MVMIIRSWIARAAGGLLGLMLLLVAAPLVVHAQDVTQGYKADGDLQNGMIVQFKPGEPGVVRALNQKNELSMLGITVASSDAPVSLSDPTQNQVFVATYGEYAVLVSTQNGAIKAGDRIVISALDGVGMKADTQHQVVLGKALQDFSDTSNADSHVSLGDANFGMRVALGRVLVDVGVARNPAFSGDATPGVPHFLVAAARAISNKPVTALRLYAGLITLTLAIIVAGIILFAGARNGMNAVGRNPLAKKSIFRSMISVVLMAIVVVTLGLVGVYLILKV